MCEPNSKMNDKDKKEAQTDDITMVEQEKTFRHMPRILYVDTGIEKREKKEESNP